MRRESLKLLPTAPGPIFPQPTPLFARSLLPTPCTGGGVGNWAPLPRGHTQGPGVGTGPPPGGGHGRTDVRAAAPAGRQAGGGGTTGRTWAREFPLNYRGRNSPQPVFSSRGPRSPPRVAAVAAAAAGASTSAISSPPWAPVSPASTMPILLFLIDTSASMNQRSHLGTTYLDTAKGAVETFMKVPTDRAPVATPTRWPAGGRAEGGRRGYCGRRGRGDPSPTARAGERAGGRWERAPPGLAHVGLLRVRGWGVGGGVALRVRYCGGGQRPFCHW